MEKTQFRTFTIATFLCYLAACQPAPPDIVRLERDAREKLICQKAFDQFNDRLYDFWLQNHEEPTTDEFQNYLQKGIEADEHFSYLPTKEKRLILKAALNYYHFVTKTLLKRAHSPNDKLQMLAALELGDSELKNEDLQKQWREEKALFKRALIIANLNCTLPNAKSHHNSQSLQTSQKSDLSDIELTTDLPRAVEGLRRVLATAYQSCDSLEQAPIDALTQDLEGVKTLKKRHRDGIGQKRIYGNLKKILETHPYYNSSPPTHCYDSRNKPLIYDYGGKPHATTDPQSPLDFFTNHGSGTDVLGLDCSAFIFSSFARGGLKLDPKKELKPVLVNGISARMYKDPVKNGLGCFEFLKNDELNPLKPGDVIASTGHVAMVDNVGADPFGLHRAQSLYDCTTDTLSADGFDFVIAQSSPWKEGVGISRSKASDYLSSAGSFKTGLEKYAVEFCRYRYLQKKQKLIRVPEVSLVRHNGSTTCISEAPVGLQFESCIRDCKFSELKQ